MSEWLIDRGKIRMELLRRDLRQADLARMVKTSEATISQVLSGQRQNPRMVARIATALGLPLDEVVQVRDLQPQA